MLEAGLDQGAGLRQQMPTSQVRLIPVIRHHAGQPELDLLWRLCQAFGELGMPVAVLDTCTAESAQQPGLLQLLDESVAVHQLADPQGLPWIILPAGLGWRQRVSAHGLSAAMSEQLNHLFSDYTVVLVYGAAELLGPTLSHSDARPLVALEAQREQLITAYTAIKQLLADSLLLPTAAVLLREPTEAAIRQAVQVRQALSTCVTKHVGCAFDGITIQTYAHDDSAGRDVRRLALRLLEHAMPLGGAMPAQVEAPAQIGLFVRSH